jgi:hypothetical protein
MMNERQKLFSSSFVVRFSPFDFIPLLPFPRLVYTPFVPKIFKRFALLIAFRG